MKKKLRLSIILGIPAFILLLFYLTYNGQISARAYINDQLNIIISTKDTNLIKKISYDTGTYDFLMGLSKDARCENTSDAQGGSKTDGTSYYATRINNKKVTVMLKNNKKINMINNIFPSYEIVNIRKW